LLVHYDAAVLDYPAVEATVRAAASAAAELAAAPPRRVEIPVTYGGEAGPDLDFVARRAGLTPAQVVGLHTGREYRVYLMGFTPGFAYLGELDERIETPRLETPRLRVPAGSVGIAGRQTGIYPLESPGGWRLIGLTALTLFDPAAAAPFLLAPGDLVRFVAVG
jgi:KipI family sensor histidine kinase inhibitor